MDQLIAVGIAVLFVIFFLYIILRGRFFQFAFELPIALLIAYGFYRLGFSEIIAYGATLLAGFFLFYVNKVYQ